MGPMAKGEVTIVSGGQTGVDQGALDAALALGVPCGGWCPKGRLCESGTIDARYPLREMTRGGYRQRTLQNIVDSDATLILYFGYPRGGTELTLASAIKRGKPYLLIDAEEVTAQRAAERVARFVAESAIRVLNVAGPRASGEPRAHDYAFAVIERFLTL